MGLIVDVSYSHEELNKLPCPEGTRTHRPVPHGRFVDLIKNGLRELGIEVAEEEHGTDESGNRYYGCIRLRSPDDQQHPDWRMMLGLRNAHDKAFASAMALGQEVFACKNGSFHGEVVVNRKHTNGIERDLPGLINEAIARLTEHRENIIKRTEAYRAAEITDERADHLIVAAAMTDSIPGMDVPRLARMWRAARKHEIEDFRPRTVWSLFNCFTERLKESSPLLLTSRSMKVAGLLDMAVNLNT